MPSKVLNKVSKIAFNGKYKNVNGANAATKKPGVFRRAFRFFFLYRVENLYTVDVLYVCPAFKVVEGKVG